ncbi:DUF190 domain-containing protein [Laribacter hongkongensis]|jgi:DNA-binding PadR family transcriptional regulator|uniref:DUF190 domain-containing protein n=2 Tax=Laribacter hongkongensis TaxID=168471 RepID=UPI001EFC91D8|nr:DUF190 domain-containing protein [Laribacter hongkongensis]MCG9032360.1 DUF190 domain-containing protein [Laribacter hongkongensis]MCG9066353.1 DUF190 domain-containing protein [Laribacter hongkongensis]MCG9093381.1 DUF190 domain-containing protein [Laribacter hongkongensis]MCG9116979.1 DUF190 domain-containing protein [Laribacter hongkongensis]
MGTTARKQAIISALTDFKEESLVRFGPPPMSADLISRIIGEPEKIRSIYKTLREMSKSGILTSEKTKKEFIFTRDGKKLLQIRKCTVYWNTRTIEIDRVQATLWNRSQDKKQPTDIKEPTNQ